MTKSEIGKMIKRRRRELEITQKELCTGICSESMLSKIESGKNIGGTEILRLLFERLGMPSDIINQSSDEKNSVMYQQIREANQYYWSGEKEKAISMMDELGKDYDSFSNANKQFYDTIDTLILFDDKAIKAKDRLYLFEQILKTTVKNYNINNLPHVMTKLEIILLSYIANEYIWMEDYDTACTIYYHIKSYVENCYEDKIMASTILPNFCYNLSKCLGLTGRYDECISVAKQGIKCCNFTREIDDLPECMYNCAWSMDKRGNQNDKEEAIKLCREALTFCNSISTTSATLPGKIKALLDKLTN